MYCDVVDGCVESESSSNDVSSTIGVLALIAHRVPCFLFSSSPPIHPHPLSTTHPQHPTDLANQRQGQF